MIGKELLEAAESFFLIAVGHHKGVRQSAESGNAEADSRTHVRCACAAADVRGARGQHTGLGPVGAATAKLDNAASPGRGDHACCLGRNHGLEGQCGQQKGLDNLCFDDGSGDAQQRFLTEDGRAFGNGPDFTREAEGFQVVEESVADVSERSMPTKEADVLGLETNVFQEVEGLIEPGGKEIAALRRQRAHKKFEAGGGAEAVLKIGRRHGEFVKVREQGRMAKGFGHEEGLWENYRGPRGAVMAFEGEDGLLLAFEVALAPPCVSCARAPLTLSECSDTPSAPFLVCQSKKDWIFTFALSRTLATPEIGR